MNSRTLSVSISAPPAAVYAFAVDPMNLPKWAAGLCRSVERVAGKWLLQTADGPMTFAAFATDAALVEKDLSTLKKAVERLS